MRYATARYEQNQREWLYRIYVTDSLKYLAGLNIRYADIFTFEEETRTAGEIIDGVKNKLRQMGGE